MQYCCHGRKPISASMKRATWYADTLGNARGTKHKYQISVIWAVPEQNFSMNINIIEQLLFHGTKFDPMSIESLGHDTFIFIIRNPISWRYVIRTFNAWRLFDNILYFISCYVRATKGTPHSRALSTSPSCKLRAVGEVSFHKPSESFLIISPFKTPDHLISFSRPDETYYLLSN
jgi:hypothetical protein